MNGAAGPPTGASPVTRRLLRGYSAAAVLVLVVALVSLAAPSRVPKGSAAASTSTAAVVLVSVLGAILLAGLAVLLATRKQHGAQTKRAMGSFLLEHRVLRGYAPAAVLGLVVALIAVLVPSTSHPITAQTRYRNVPVTASGSGSNASGLPASGGGTAGTAGSAGTSGQTVNSPGVAGRCTGDQVPGDPYSPPCITFSGSNGGATSTGVSGNTITVTARLTTDQNFQNTLAQLAGAQLQDTNADNQRTLNALVEYFNTHFQLYGRKMVVKYFTGQGSLASELQGYGQAQAEADAATAQSLGAFADITAGSEPYATSLWQNGILGFGDPYLPNGWHHDHAPYDWSLATDGTDLATDVGYYAVNKLCGGGAAYAGADLKGQPRKFAGVAPQNELYQESANVFSKIMAAHNCNDTQFAYTLDLGTESQQAANLVAQLKAGGYTTILCGCDPIFPVYLSGQAAQQGYFPEFVEIGAALVDQDYVGQLYNQRFYTHAFGISPNLATVPYTQTLGYAAYQIGCKEQPSICNGQGPSFFVPIIYLQLDMLAIGIQMSGPHLTPGNYQSGMFAYPPKLGPAGLWGWSPTQYTIPNDFREVCWSPDTISPFNGKPGAYLQGAYNGARWTASSVPTGPPGCPIPNS